MLLLLRSLLQSLSAGSVSGDLALCNVHLIPNKPSTNGVFDIASGIPEETRTNFFINLCYVSLCY